MSHYKQAGPSQERPPLPSWRQLTLARQEQEDAARYILREEPSDASESTSTISGNSEDVRNIVRQPRNCTDAKRAAEHLAEYRNPQGATGRAHNTHGNSHEAERTQTSSNTLHLHDFTSTWTMQKESVCCPGRALCTFVCNELTMTYQLPFPLTTCICQLEDLYGKKVETEARLATLLQALLSPEQVHQ